MGAKLPEEERDRRLRERQRKYARKYYAEHKEMMAARAKAWKARNPEKVKAYSRRYYDSNYEKISAYKKEYYQRKKAEAAG